MPVCQAGDSYSSTLGYESNIVTGHLETVRPVLSELIPGKFKVCVSLNGFRIGNRLLVYFFLKQNRSYSTHFALLRETDPAICNFNQKCTFTTASDQADVGT